jgi:hypothetical protein
LAFGGELTRLASWAYREHRRDFIRSTPSRSSVVLPLAFGWDAYYENNDGSAVTVTRLSGNAVR